MRALENIKDSLIMISLVDIILSIVLILSFIYGLYIGFISVLFPLSALVITILTITDITTLLINNFDFYKDTLPFKIITYFLVYILIRIIFALFEKPLKKGLKSLSLGFVEKLLGGLSLVTISSLVIVLLFFLVLSFLKKDLSYTNSTILNVLFYYLSPILKLIHL